MNRQHNFYLPNTSVRGPNEAWISNKRWDTLSNEQRKGFAYIEPDFVVEFASLSDNLAVLTTKMEKWRGNAVRLRMVDSPISRNRFYLQVRWNDKQSGRF